MRSNALKIISIGILVFGVGLAPFLPVYSQADTLTAVFKFAKSTYQIGEAIKGTVTLTNAGANTSLKVAYPTVSGNQAKTTTKKVKLGTKKLNLGVKAETAGDLEVKVTVTNPKDKKFKKIFTHMLQIEGNNNPTPSSGTSTDDFINGVLAKCPPKLTEAAVRQICKIPEGTTIALTPPPSWGGECTFKITSEKDIKPDVLDFLEYQAKAILPGDWYYDRPLRPLNWKESLSSDDAENEPLIGFGEKAEIIRSVQYDPRFPVAYQNSYNPIAVDMLFKAHRFMLSSKGRLAQISTNEVNTGPKGGWVYDYVIPGEGCDLEEIKTIVKDIIIPHIQQQKTAKPSPVPKQPEPQPLPKKDKDTTWKNGCPPVSTVAALCTGPQKLVTRLEPEIKKGVENGYPFDYTICAYDAQDRPGIMINIDRLSPPPMTTAEMDESITAMTAGGKIIARNEVGIRSGRFQFSGDLGEGTLLFYPTTSSQISISTTAFFEPNAGIDNCRSEDLLKIGKLFIK